MGRTEVADSDGPHPPFVKEPLQRPVGVDGGVEVLRQGLVQEVEVHRVDAQLAGADLEGMQRTVEAVVGHPDLGLDEELGPLDAARQDGGADLTLVHVGSGGVNHAVAGPQGLLDGGLGDIGWRLEDAKAEGRQLDAIVEPDGWMLLRVPCWHATPVDAVGMPRTREWDRSGRWSLRLGNLYLGWRAAGVAGLGTPAAARYARLGDECCG